MNPTQSLLVSRISVSLHVTAFLLLILSLQGCRKSNASAFTPGRDIYMAGEAGGHAVYWKNGQRVDLPGMVTATGITLSGTDVYTCGWAVTPHDQLAAYCKNGVQTNLTSSGTSNAYGISVSGSDVYVAGSLSAVNNNRAVYWKNDSLVYLSPNTNAAAIGITTNGVDLYVVGNVGGDSAVCWKNGVQKWYSIDGYGASMNAVTVSGSDLYVVGGGPANYLQPYDGDGYWKNDDSYVTLANYGHGRAIAVEGSDVYVAGSSYDNNGRQSAAYWKNGGVFILANQYSSAMATGIAVVGNDVYVTGFILDNNTGYAVYWKNNAEVRLSVDGSCNAIVVGQ